MVLAVEGNVTQMDRQIRLGRGDHVRCGHEVGDALGRALRKMRVGDQCDVHAPWWVLGHVMAMTASQSGQPGRSRDVSGGLRLASWRLPGSLNAWAMARRALSARRSADTWDNCQADTPPLTDAVAATRRARAGAPSGRGPPAGTRTRAQSPPIRARVLLLAC